MREHAQVHAPIALPAAVRIGTPSAGPTRRMFILEGTNIDELEIDATGVATVHDSFTPADLGLTFIANAPNLTPDGLHLVAAGIVTGDIWQRVVYSDRPDLASRFRTADLIPGVALVNDPFLTADCGRIYFSAVTSVMFVQRD
ncbi:MAG TPA: hypothetical protein VLB44_00250 [Kofleriaceae bacterium]|nr:hypothetical protein [Kofleriaceae bacterium]